MTDILLSLPGNPGLHECVKEISRGWGDIFISSDPPEKQLGSGGGACWILAEAWKESRNSEKGVSDFPSWLAAKPRMVIQGSGESRRLPAYSPAGKPLIPIPEMVGVPGQYPVEFLLRLQYQTFRSILDKVPGNYRLMITCGDTLILNHSFLPKLPEADVLIFGLSVSAEEASRHGVMITRFGRNGEIDRFLQKPSADELSGLDKWEDFHLDSGIWLLSRKAVDVLLDKCEWDGKREDFRAALPEHFDLYGEFGRALGVNPEREDAEIGALTTAAVPLDQASFHHFGTNRTLLASVNQLRNPAAQRAVSPPLLNRINSSPVILHSDVEVSIGEDNRFLWIDNSIIPSGWRLSEKHVLTNVPANDWSLQLPPGSCLDFQAVDGQCSIRNYNFDDNFMGRLGDDSTEWMGGRALNWFEARHITPEEAGLIGDVDIFEAELFPLAGFAEISEGFIQWMLDRRPEPNPGFRCGWLESTRLSGRQLLQRADFRRNWRERIERITREAREGKRVYNLDHYDLAEVAKLFGESEAHALYAGRGEGLEEVRYRAFLSRCAEADSDHDRALREEQLAFSSLRKLLIDELRTDPQSPGRNVLEDQIVWGRSPIRFDLAGGWTDTPPYCLYRGGKVVNFAADLNGQAPIQVFARISAEPRILMRSIDLGLDEQIETFDELLARDRLGGGFGIARACLELAGFSQEFSTLGRISSLPNMLEASVGGGIELSMVSAIPKGSGLGTSSILAATILGALSELCGLNWSIEEIYFRTLAVEQMMNLGGGWQDQVGGLYGGVKFIESEPGLEQRVSIRTLPESSFDTSRANVTVLLYYTGAVRHARQIFSSVVRGVLNNDSEHMRRLWEIASNAEFMADSLKRNDDELLSEAVRRGWELKKALDPGTESPEISEIIDRISPYSRAWTLAGAGGGGYLLIFANSVRNAEIIRSNLAEDPPNDKARFVDFQVSRDGFQVSRN